VDLRAALNGTELAHYARHCSLQEALRQLDVLFECSGEADFFLAVRAPDGPWCQLATRRWRLAMYFITSQYERAFVRAAHSTGEHAPAARAASPDETLGHRAPPPLNVPSFVEQSGVLPALVQENDARTGTAKLEGS
jgi:hypothetical protein